MKRIVLAALAVLLLAGCGSHGYAPPESARHPEGSRRLASPRVVTLSPGESTIDNTGLRLVEGFEGYSRCAYRDPVGVLTAGFGQTHGIFPGFCFPSRAAAAENLRVSVVREYEWAVHAVSRTFGQHATDALDSFAYNLGAGIFIGSLRFYLARHAYFTAGQIMLQYDHAGGQVLPGLRTRREAEVRLLRWPDPVPPVPPKPSRAHLLAELHAHTALLGHLRAQVLHLRHKLAAHRCGRHPRRNPCLGWKRAGKRVHAHGRVEDRIIARLKHELGS